MKSLKFFKKSTSNRCLKFIAAGILAVAAVSAARAALAVPYALDTNTLHLWHFDEPSGTNSYDSATNNASVPAITLTVQPGPTNFWSGNLVNGPTQFALLGQMAAFPGLGGSILTTQYSCMYAPYITKIDGNSADPTYGEVTNTTVTPAYTNLSYCINTNTGAFTWEALLYPVVNPVTETLQTQEIICGDSGQPTRGWQFRITEKGQLECNININVSPATNIHDVFATLPTTGPDAAVAGQWYHVAVTFTGTNPPAGQTKEQMTLYWTKLDPTRTNCDALLVTNLTTGMGGEPVVTIGGNFRTTLFTDAASSEGFEGYIDEVRMSSVCRTSTQMAFNTNNVDVTPVFTVEPPASTLAGYGRTLTLSSSISGTSPLQIQWKQNGTNLISQTNSVLVLSNVTFAANGNYQCFATNTTVTYGTVGTNSTVAAVTVGAAFDDLFNTGVDANGNPLGLTAPGSVDSHYTLLNSPDAKNHGPTAIIWAATNLPSTYSEGNLSAWIGPENDTGTTAGTYAYQTTFLIDAGDPNSATLTGTIYAAGAGGTSTLQIFLNGQETDISLAANPVEAPAPFTLTVTNGLQAGSNTLQFAYVDSIATSAGIQVAMTGIGQALPPGLPLINNQPISEAVPYGSPAAFSILALGRPPLSYQWLSNGVPVSPAVVASAGTEALSFNATNVDTSFLDGSGNFDANYQVVVSNASGSVTSSVAVLTITNLAPQIAQFPASGTNTLLLYPGASAGFSALAAGGVPPFSYQWVSNGVTVAGATNASFGLTNVQSGMVYDINCTVGNSTTSVTGTVWTASVIAAPTAPYPAAVLAANPIGYWRLNEGPDNGQGDQGFVCNDYVGGHAGTYTNVTLAQPGYNPATDPAETSTEFGETGISFYDSYAGQIAGVDFATPTNTSATFSIVAWVNGYAGSEPSGAGLVSKGYGGGGEQFDLDVYGGTYRFFVRDVSSAVHGFTATNTVDGNWHLVAGVCDEVHGSVSLYVDGALAGSGSVTPGMGILEDTRPMCIGSRSSSATSDNNYQFYGYMNDVAVYNYALSASQVLTLFFSSPGTPFFTQQPPASAGALAGGTLTVSAGVGGVAPLTNQWWNATLNAPVAGQTNSTLVLSDVSSGLNGDQVYLAAANAYGSTNSTYVTLSILSSPPTLAVMNLGAGQLQLGWSAGTLQSATNVAGPFLSITNVTSPFTTATTNAQRFFRVSFP